MAAKIKLMKLLQELRGLAEITSRRPSARTPGLFMVQLRSHLLQATLSRRRRRIVIEMKEGANIPDPVKIIHLKAGSLPPSDIARATQTLSSTS